MLEPILQGARGAAISLADDKQGRRSTPAPGAVAGSSRAVGRPAVGSFTQHAAPGPGSGIVYDPASGLYVNDPRPPSGATQAPNELSIRPLPSAPGASGLRAVQPSSETPQKVGPTAAPQSHTWGWFHHSSPRSDSGSSAAPRSGGATAGGHATSGSGSRGGGATSGAARSGGGSMAGASQRWRVGLRRRHGWWLPRWRRVGLRRRSWVVAPHVGGRVGLRGGHR